MADGQTPQAQTQQAPPQPPLSGQTVPAFSPDGTLGDIPAERAHDAVKSGFKLGVDLVSPDGQPGAVPIERVHDAMQKGFKLPATMPENYGFTAGNMAGQAWRGTKELVGGLYDMGKDVLFPQGASESDKLKFLAHKYIIDPAKEQEEKAQTAATPAESIGHSIAEAIPLVGPWAANLGEQAGTGDVGGAIARGGTQVLAAELGGKGIKGAKELTQKGVAKAARATGVGGFTPPEALEKAGRPAVHERHFKESVERALPRILEENKIEPIKNPEGMADAAHSAANKLWEQEAQPQVDRHTNELMSGKDAADAIRNGVDEGTRDLFPEQAQEADTLADKIDGLMSLRKSAAYLKTLNAQLKSYYRMDPQARYAKGMTDARISGMENAADALRDGIYSRLEQLGEQDPAGLRQQYGALKQIERVFEKRAIVHGRQAPFTLPQAIGAIVGVAGHPLAAGVPLLTKYLNAPETLIRGAVKEPAAPSSPLPKSVTRGAVAGATTASDGDTSDWRRIQTSDGATFLIHPEDLPEAQRRDPGLKALDE
jgi:hypothetical protein